MTQTFASNEAASTTAGNGFDRLSEFNLDRISRLIVRHVGIRLPATKRLMVEGRLRKRMRETGHARLDDYCRFLFDENGLAGELVHVIDAVTTNKTEFFREREHFALLASTLVPALLDGRGAGARSRLKLWSAASSNGAEAYSLAMMMASLADRYAGLQFAVLGTDISTEMLDQAMRAIYPVEMIEPVPSDMQSRHFMRGRSPSWHKEVRVVPELRRLVRFERLNLMDENYSVDRDVDIIFLRNVLIYFEKPTQEAVVQRLVGHLRPGGFIVLGHSESMIGSNLRLKQWAPGVFQRTRDAQ